MKIINRADIDGMEKRFRTTFINCLSGYKSPLLVGTINADKQTNLTNWNKQI